MMKRIITREFIYARTFEPIACEHLIDQEFGAEQLFAVACDAITRTSFLDLEVPQDCLSCTAHG